ncbi:MAG: thiamine diphosphokinase [Chloroflexota bacterium]
MSTARALIFANGLLPDMESARKLVQPGDVLYAADGGANHILGLGLLPSLVVGDLDSLTEENLQKLLASSVRIVHYPQDKDLTDLELTINCALDEGYHRLVIVGALGGRLDMTLSNLSLLTRPALLDIDVSLDDGVEQVFFVTKEVLISGKSGDIISLLPWGGKVEQVTTNGLRWELYNEDLNSYETRSISNEMRTGEAKICIGSGLLLCIHCRQDPSK